MTETSQILYEGLDPTKRRVYSDPHIAVELAVAEKRRFLIAEPFIVRHPGCALRYAMHVMHSRWPEAERGIARNPDLALQYAEHVVRDRWPEAEPFIKRCPEQAFQYANTVIKGRWPEAEKLIAEDSTRRHYYLSHFPEAKDDWLANGWIDWLD